MEITKQKFCFIISVSVATIHSPDFFIVYLTQNVIFHVKSHVFKHEFWGLLILKSQHPMLPNLTWNETWNDTPLKKSGDSVFSIKPNQKSKNSKNWIFWFS